MNLDLTLSDFASYKDLACDSDRARAEMLLGLTLNQRKGLLSIK